MSLGADEFIDYRTQRLQASYNFAFNNLDIILIHGLQGAVDEESDLGR